MSANLKFKSKNDSEDGYCLSETAYSFGYILRQKYSELKQGALDWFSQEGARIVSADIPKVLSLGCGNGIFDIGLMKILLQHKHSLHFTGIDFNSEDIDGFETNILDLNDEIQKNIVLKCEKFDQLTNLNDRFDLITMVHFLHSFEVTTPIVKNAFKHLSPKGKLLIIQQNNEGVSEIKSGFLDILPNQKFQSSDQIKRDLKDDGISFVSHKINTHFDVSIMKEMSLDTLLLMSFCFSNDLSVLDSIQQEEIRQAFMSHASLQVDGRLIINEPIEAIICEASAN